MNRADARGNGQFLGPDPYFDDLFCMAAARGGVHVLRAGSSPPPTSERGEPVHTLLINRTMVDGVIETPNGAHFTSCAPDYEPRRGVPAAYAAAAADAEAWADFKQRFLAGDEADYQAAAVARSR